MEMRLLKSLAIATVLVLGFVVSSCSIPGTNSSNCAAVIAQQIATTQVIKGSFACLSPDQQAGAQAYDINNDKTFADAIGNDNTTYRYLGRTKDDGYIYEFDVAMNPYNHKARAWADMKAGNFQGAVSEFTGGTTHYTSTIHVFYLDNKGKLTSVQ